MKEVCGYKSLDNQFYENKKDCEKADLKYRIRILERNLNNFETEIREYIFKGYEYYNSKTGYGLSEDKVLNRISRLILQNSDGFINIINQKQQLEKDLDELRRTYDSKYNKPWWLEWIWWK